jgi:hypothetical protein
MLGDGDAGVRGEAAKAIGAIPEPAFAEELVRLLYDGEEGVVRSAMGAVRRRVGRDGYRPLYVASLVSLLSRRRLKHEAREALVAFGEAVVPALVHFMNDPDEQIWVRRALPKTLARIGTPAAARGLLDSLPKNDDPFLRRKLIAALGGLHRERPVSSEDAPAIAEEVHAEAMGYLQALAQVFALGLQGKGRFDGLLVRWDGEEAEPGLLERLLADRMEDGLRNLFGLLALLHPPVHVWAAYRSLRAGDGAVKAGALEYLDNVLTGGVRRDAFAVIDDAPLAEKLERARRLAGTGPLDKQRTLARFLAPAADDAAREEALAAAALYTVYTDRIEGLYALVTPLISPLPRGREESPPPLARETARWVARRLGIG